MEIRELILIIIVTVAYSSFISWAITYTRLKRKVTSEKKELIGDFYRFGYYDAYFGREPNYCKERIKLVCEKPLKLCKEQACEALNKAKLENLAHNLKNWILCKNEMPRKGQLCLITVKNEQGTYLPTYAFYFTNKYWDSAMCFSAEKYCTEKTYYYSIDDVIAWQPLPEPYKGKRVAKIKDCPKVASEDTIADGSRFDFAK